MESLTHSLRDSLRKWRINWAESIGKQKKRRKSNYDVCYLLIKLCVFYLLECIEIHHSTQTVDDWDWDEGGQCFLPQNASLITINYWIDSKHSTTLMYGIRMLNGNAIFKCKQIEELTIFWRERASNVGDDEIFNSLIANWKHSQNDVSTTSNWSERNETKRV